VLLYPHWWDIEKIFHELKSKINERKSWASPPEAKKSRAIFDWLSNHLLLLLEKYLVETESIRDEVEEIGKTGRFKEPPERSSRRSGI
jgi:hypothetical protein